MSNLIKRLRSANATGGVADKYNEAADRIEELERQLAETKEREQTNDTLLEQQGDKLAALHDQIALLREALSELGKRLATRLDEDDWNTIEPFLQKCAALAATEEKK